MLHVGDPTSARVTSFTFHPPHTLCFKAETGNAFTTFLAGFALTITTLPKTSLFPAFVAGFILVLILHTPGMGNIPVLFTTCMAISAQWVSRALRHPVGVKGAVTLGGCQGCCDTQLESPAARERFCNGTLCRRQISKNSRPRKRGLSKRRLLSQICRFPSRCLPSHTEDHCRNPPRAPKNCRNLGLKPGGSDSEPRKGI